MVLYVLDMVFHEREEPGPGFWAYVDVLLDSMTGEMCESRSNLSAPMRYGCGLLKPESIPRLTQLVEAV